jgi:hypothetical protein
MNINKFVLISLLGTLLPVCACESSRVCPPSEPIYKWKEIPKPYPVVIRFEALPPLVLPDWPEHPGPEATEEELKEWALETEKVAKERDVLKSARIEALEIREATLWSLKDSVTLPTPVPD